MFSILYAWNYNLSVCFFVRETQVAGVNTSSVADSARHYGTRPQRRRQAISAAVLYALTRCSCAEQELYRQWAIIDAGNATALRNIMISRHLPVSSFSPDILYLLYLYH